MNDVSLYKSRVVEYQLKVAPSGTTTPSGFEQTQTYFEQISTWFAQTPTRCTHNPTNWHFLCGLSIEMAEIFRKCLSYYSIKNIRIFFFVKLQTRSEQAPYSMFHPPLAR